MPAPTLTVHELDGTQIGSALTAQKRKGSNRWNHRPGDDGAAMFTAKGDLPATQLPENMIVRINDGSSDVFGFVATQKDRRALDAPGVTELDLSGPGLRWLLHRIQVLQEDLTDCAEPADARWFGWMSAAYDDSTWTAPASFGTYVAGPFVNPRPEDWDDPLAQFIGPSTAALPARTWYARRTFTVATEQDVYLQAAADDEYRVFLDGREVSELNTIDGGPFQWRQRQQRPLRICPGEHVLAVEVRNLQRASAATNVTWLLCSLLPANTTTGLPEANDQQYAVYHDHTGGTFTLTTDFGFTTAAIAHNANAAAVQAALEALDTIGAGNVDVTGSGSVASPWIITFQGDLESVRVAMTATSSLTGGTGLEVDEYVRGGYANPVVRTDTDWVILDNPATIPGLTAGQILDLVLDEAAARGDSIADHITRGFTGSTDTDGADLGQLVLPVSLPADAHRVTVMLEELDHAIEMAPDLTLDLWANRGADLTGTVSILAHSPGVKNLVASQSETEIANVFRVRTDEGWVEAVDAASVAARGRCEAGQSLEGFGNEAEAQQVTGPLLERYANPVRTTTCDISSTAPVAIVPYSGVPMSALVTASAFSEQPDTFDEIDMRLVGVSAQVDDDHILYSIELIA